MGRLVCGRFISGAISPNALPVDIRGTVLKQELLTSTPGHQGSFYRLDPQQGRMAIAAH